MEDFLSKKKKYASNTIQNRYAWSINAYHGELVGAKTGVDVVRRLKLPPSETVREAFHRPKAWYYAVTAVEPVFTLQVRQPPLPRLSLSLHCRCASRFASGQGPSTFLAFPCDWLPLRPKSRN